MFRFAIHNGIIVTIATLIICTLGIAALFRVPVQMIPDMDVTTLSVITRWAGATPQDIEKEILIEQEKYLRNLPNLTKMTSEASTGRAVIELEFQLGSDINEALIYTNNALSQVPTYPENVDQPRILTSVFSSNSFMYFAIQALPDNPKSVDILMQRDFIEDNVRTALERVPGVSEVRVRGGSERQIKVYLDPAKLAVHHISLKTLRQALRARNRDMSGGDLDSGKRRYLLRTVGRFKDIAEIENTVIAYRAGTPIYLRDVGYAELGYAEVQWITQVNGEKVISLSIKRQLGSNVIKVMDGVMATVERLNATLLHDQGLMMRLNSEDVQYVRDAIVVVGQNLLIGGLLATFILFLFLRALPATLIGALGIPVCTIAAFLGLLLLGRTINVISLVGIALAIGMTLDNSIVVLENIDRHRRSGKPLFQAALDGVEEVWTAVLASTLTTVFVFLPIIFVQEEAGQLYSDIAIAISAAILMSMLVAVTLVPAAAARLMGSSDKQSAPTLNTLGRIGLRFKQQVTVFMTWLLSGLLRRFLLIGAVLAITFGIMWGLTPKAEYLPEGEEAKVFAFMFPPPGYNLQEMSQVGEAINAYFLPHLHAERTAFDQGDTEVPPLDLLLISVSNARLMLIAITAHDNMDALIAAVSHQFDQVPGMRAFASRGSIFSGNLGGTRSVELDITGPDLPDLYAVTLKAFLKAKQVFDDPQVRPVPGLTLGQPLLEIRPDWHRVEELGIETGDLGYLIWALADGAYLDEFFLADDKIDMFLYSTAGTIQRPQDLKDLPIYTATGEIVPLGAVADITTTVNTETIRRIDGLRTLTLAIVAPRDIALETAVEKVETELIAALKEAGEIPAGVHLQIGGASDKLKATREALSGNFTLALLICYFLLVAIFSHWGYPFIILLTVPLGVGGGILGLWLMNEVIGIQQSFDMITLLGFLVLIGTVVNNPILLVERAVKNRYQHGMTVATAVVESTQIRLRPIMMTTITTVFGLSPLVFLPGAGTELYRGLGTIVLFGLLFSTLITLTLTPALLSLLLQLSDWTRNHIKRAH